MSIEDLASEVTSTGPLPISNDRTVPRAGFVGAETRPKPDISLVNAATSRIAALESEIQELQQHHDQLQHTCKMKDKEIQRLQGLLTSKILQTESLETDSPHQHAQVKLHKKDERKMEELVARVRKAEANADRSKDELDKVAQSAEACKREVQRECQRQVAKLRIQLSEVQKSKQETEDKLIKSEEQRQELQKRLDRRESVIDRAQARCKNLEARLAKLETAQMECDTGDSMSSTVISDFQSGAGLRFIKPPPPTVTSVLRQTTPSSKWAIHAKRKWNEVKNEVQKEEIDEEDSKLTHNSTVDNEQPHPFSYAPPSTTNIENQVASLTAQLDASHQKLEVAASKIEALQAELLLYLKDESRTSVDASHQTDDDPSMQIQNSRQHEQHNVQEILCQKIEECKALEQAGRQAQELVGNVVQQLKRATVELQESRVSEADLKTQLASATERVEALEKEKNRLEGVVKETRIATEHQAVRLAEVFEAERQVVAAEFESLSSQFQSLSQEYYNAKASVIVASQERDQALHEAQTIATKLVCQEQSCRALHEELHNITVQCTQLQEEKSELRALVASMQQDMTVATCQARMGGERELAAQQRRAVTAESKVAMLEVKLADAESKTNVLKLELNAANQRTEAVEALLAELRAEQFRREDERGSLVNQSHGVGIPPLQPPEATPTPLSNAGTQQEPISLPEHNMVMEHNESRGDATKFDHPHIHDGHDNPAVSHVCINKALEQLHRIAQGLEQLSHTSSSPSS